MTKTLKSLALKLDEREYHDYPAWSYSTIAKYAKEGFAALATLHDKVEPTSAMEFGSLFDSIITRGKRTMDEYVVYDREVPAAEKRVLDMLVTMTTCNILSEVPDETIISATTDCGYYPKWGFDAKYKHLAEFDDYFAVARTGKKIVSRTDWEDAMEMARVFRKDEYLKDLFGTQNTTDIEYAYQTQFVTDMTLPSGRTVSVKIMPDLLKIDHRFRTVQPVDLKTSSIPAWNFKENFLKFRYDLQASVYTDVLRRMMDLSEDLNGYKILPYLFTDISRTDKVPVTYLYDQTDLSQSDGLHYTIGDKTYQYKHWTALLDEIIDLEESNAVVPQYISTTVPNNILELIDRK